jgi:TM2 domain-containing membrane protein YozV/RNA polymerase subunit RPABC4/transcription elongation factor Spt4
LIKTEGKQVFMAQEDSDSQDEQNDTSSEPGEDEKYCSNCGEIIDEQAEVCPECGVRVKEDSGSNEVNINMENNQVQSTASQDVPAGNKSKVLAGLLGIFLGGIGVHKLYLGQPGRAIIFFLLSWTGIPMLVGLIQGISYLLMSDQKFARKFG